MAPPQALNATGEARILPHKAEDLLSGGPADVKSPVQLEPCLSPQWQVQPVSPLSVLVSPQG